MCDPKSQYKTVPQTFTLDFEIKNIMHRRLSLQSYDSVRKYVVYAKPYKAREARVGVSRQYQSNASSVCFTPSKVAAISLYVCLPSRK